MSASGRELPTSFDEALRVVRQILSSNHELVRQGLVDTEAEQIVAAAYRGETGKALARMDLFTRARDRIPEKAAERALIWAAARSEGKLLQHLTGVQTFLGHEYEVGPDVLVPRPETEVLATEALDVLNGLQPELGVEIGLGSGILSIELLAHFPKLQMIASELSASAVSRARKNAERILGESSDRLTVFQIERSSDVLEPFKSTLSGKRKADFIISNPPYLLPEDEIEAGVRQYEPQAALFSPPSDPIYFYRKIAEAGSYLLNRDGFVFLEIPHNRADLICEAFADQNWKIRLVQDLTGRDRVLVAQRR